MKHWREELTLRMISLWKIVRTLMAIIGIMLIFGGVGTSDYYLLELGQPEPNGVWTTIFIGFMLVVPTAIHIVREQIKGEDHV